MKYLITIAIIFLLTDTAHAYLEFNSTKALLHIGLAITAGGVYAIKLYWRQIKGFIKKIIKKNKGGKNEKSNMSEL